ncbi:MAG: tetratricopeptide repeat protein [Bryobacteraceae bacterium]
MLRRITAVPFLVCWWCSAQAAQDSEELDRRLRLVESERSHGRLASAESMLTNVQADIERTEGPGLRLAVALKEHGLLRDDAGRPEEAIPFYARALAMIRSLPGASPVTEGMLLANLASSHADRGESEMALSLSTQAMTLLLASVDRTHPEFAVSLYAHGVALHSLGRNAEALRDQREALDIWRRAAEPDYVQLALLNDSIAMCLTDLGYHSRAEASEREALAIRQKTLEPNSLGIAASLNNLGVILSREQRFSEGRQSLESAALIFEQFGESEQQRLTAVLGNLGGLYYAQARNRAQLYAKAEEVYRRKLAIEERMLGPSDTRVAATLAMLGEVLYRERAYNEAGRIYGRSLAIQQAAFGSQDPKTQAAAKRYNVLVKKMKVDPER